MTTQSTGFDRLNDDCFYLRCDDSSGIKVVFRLLQLTVEFSSFQTDSIYEEKQERNLIKTYGYDFVTNSLILLKVPADKKKKKEGKTVSIVDLNEQATLYSTKIEDTELVGRLKTSSYLFVDGHIYYNNKCIKIRFDLLRDIKGVREYGEYEIFDFYDKILTLKINEEVQKGMPICTPEEHRMVYVIKNKKELGVKKMLVLPYLHERKVFLSKTKDKC